MAEAYIRISQKSFVYPDDKYLVECCKGLFTHLTLKQEDFRSMKELVIEVIQAKDFRKKGEFHYPIVKSETLK